MIGENPERGYQGELCDKIFPNGRVLGGHMSLPVAKNIAEGEPPLVIDDGGLEEAGRPGYRLRVNPKKSWKFLGLMENSQENPCPVCNKRFGSMNALCGHMKIHSRKDDGSGDRYQGKGSGSMKSCRDGAKPIHDGKRLSLSLSSEDRYVGWSKTKGDLLLSVLLDDEAMHVTRRKRTPRISYDVDERTEGVLSSTPNGFSFSSEAEQDPVYEAAVLLMILSKGEAGFNSSGLGVEPFQKRSVPDFFDVEKLRITEASDHNESHSRGYTRIKRKGVELAVPAGMLCGDREAVYKKPKAARSGEEPMYEAAVMDCDMMGIVGSDPRETAELWIEPGLNSYRDKVCAVKSQVSVNWVRKKSIKAGTLRATNGMLQSMLVKGLNGIVAARNSTTSRTARRRQSGMYVRYATRISHRAKLWAVTRGLITQRTLKPMQKCQQAQPHSRSSQT
ncbi:hypothetical protein NL676_005246 [Syzygium grande]|nr:hypothetical protein NL676_005246 [Syzygium grande]